MLQNKKVIQLIISAVMAVLFVNLYLKAKEQTIESGAVVSELDLGLLVALSVDIGVHCEDVVRIEAGVDVHQVQEALH